MLYVTCKVSEDRLNHGLYTSQFGIYYNFLFLRMIFIGQIVYFNLGMLNFHPGPRMEPERSKAGDYRMGCYQFWGIQELIFLSDLKLFELKFDQIISLRTEFFLNFEDLKCKLSEIFILGECE